MTGGLFLESSCTTLEFDVWKQKYIFAENKNINVNCSSHACTSLAGLIYVVGGYTEPNQSLLCYNATTIQTDVRDSMRHPCSHLATVFFQDKIYAIGGVPIDQDEPSTMVEVFHPLRKVWKDVAKLNVARYQPGACITKNQIVVVGGGSSVVEVYDEKNNKWKIVGECEELKDVFAVFHHLPHFAWAKSQAIPSKILNVIGPSSSRSSDWSCQSKWEKTSLTT